MDLEKIRNPEGERVPTGQAAVRAGQGRSGFARWADSGTGP
jgi:hypothetical protein